MIKQAIIPLAGQGTRLLPLTSVFAKELLPINGKPGIEYILDECITAGIKEVICVATHGILSSPALERINQCDALVKVIISDSLDQTTNCQKCSKLRVFSIGTIIGQAIKAMLSNQSLATLFL